MYYCSSKPLFFRRLFLACALISDHHLVAVIVLWLTQLPVSFVPSAGVSQEWLLARIVTNGNAESDAISRDFGIT